MSRKKEFVGELNRLYRRRTRWLRSVIGDRKPGKPAAFNGSERDKSIARLQGIAYRAYANRFAKQEFARFALSKHAWHVKGHGPGTKRLRFQQWLARTFGGSRMCIYIFWRQNGKCIYVGRSDGSSNRPVSHFQKYWFGGVRRIDIYPVRFVSQLPKLECLAVHRFLPTRNKVKASTRRWTKKCPMCKIHRAIDNELHSIFRLK